MAANPLSTNRLALDEEARAIREELERSEYRDSFELVTRWAVRPLDLLREMRKLKPTIVHFSGHGGGLRKGSQHVQRRDLTGTIDDHAFSDEFKNGLFFQGPDGRPQFVSSSALEETFEAAGASVKLVVLNACYSETQAEALMSQVAYVVGMEDLIRDNAARSFAIGFYGGLGERASVTAAFRQGCAAISLEGLPDSCKPQLKVRDGIEAEALALALDSKDSMNASALVLSEPSDTEPSPDACDPQGLVPPDTDPSLNVSDIHTSNPSDTERFHTGPSDTEPSPEENGWHALKSHENEPATVIREAVPTQTHRRDADAPLRCSPPAVIRTTPKVHRSRRRSAAPGRASRTASLCASNSKQPTSTDMMPKGLLHIPTESYLSMIAEVQKSSNVEELTSSSSQSMFHWSVICAIAVVTAVILVFHELGL